MRLNRNRFFVHISQTMDDFGFSVVSLPRVYAVRPRLFLSQPFCSIISVSQGVRGVKISI